MHGIIGFDCIDLDTSVGAYMDDTCSGMVKKELWAGLDSGNESI
jgi:hypothetical protein